MTCAIYAAIRATGYITSGNYPAIVTNVCALTYTYPPVITAICGWITALGLQNLQAMQQAGALDDVDCSGCDVTWCYYFDFRLNAQGWVLHPLVPNGVYTAGLGWQTVPVGGAIAECVIIIDMGVTVPITAIDVLLSSNQGSTGSHASDVQVDTVPGTAPGFTTFTFPANAPAYAWQDVACVASGRYCAVDVACASSGGGLTTIQAVQVRGKGVNPFGVDNCIH
jgi:hypothetical protein